MPEFTIFEYMRTLLFILLTISASSFGQARKGYNRLYVAYTPQYYLLGNSFNFDTDNKLPNPISVKNTYGYRLGIDFERVTRYGLTFSGGLQYGMQKHDANIHIDLSTFDTDAVNTLKGFVYNQAITHTSSYTAYRITLGYKIPVTKSWVISAKLGYAARYYFKGYFDYGVRDITYATDDSTQIHVSRFLAYSTLLGTFKTRKDFFLNRGIGPVWLFYIGANRKIELRWAKNLEIGVEATTTTNWAGTRRGGDYISVSTKQYWWQNDISYQSNAAYHPKSVAIGLRLAVGLWKQ